MIEINRKYLLPFLFFFRKHKHIVFIIKTSLKDTTSLKILKNTTGKKTKKQNIKAEKKREVIIVENHKSTQGLILEEPNLHIKQKAPRWSFCCCCRCRLSSLVPVPLLADLHHRCLWKLSSGTGALDTPQIDGGSTQD